MVAEPLSSEDNVVTRGNTVKVLLGVEVHGCFQLIDNRLTDFNEGKAIALALFPDAIGRACNSQYLGNIFENCNGVINESRPELWKSSMTKNNQAIECIGKIPR